jgi:hypothetical protein
VPGTISKYWTYLKPDDPQKNESKLSLFATKQIKTSLENITSFSERCNWKLFSNLVWSDN